MLYSHFIDVDFDFFRMFSLVMSATETCQVLHFGLNKMEKQTPIPQIKDEAARRAKSHVLIFYLVERGRLLKFSIYFVQVCSWFWQSEKSSFSSKASVFDTCFPRIAPRLHHTAYKWQFYLFRFRHIFSGSSKFRNVGPSCPRLSRKEKVPFLSV